mgnify:FL=1
MRAGRAPRGLIFLRKKNHPAIEAGVIALLMQKADCSDCSREVLGLAVVPRDADGRLIVGDLDVGDVGLARDALLGDKHIRDQERYGVVPVLFHHLIVLAVIANREHGHALLVAVVLLGLALQKREGVLVGGIVMGAIIVTKCLLGQHGLVTAGIEGDKQWLVELLHAIDVEQWHEDSSDGGLDSGLLYCALHFYLSS